MPKPNTAQRFFGNYAFMLRVHICTLLLISTIRKFWRGFVVVHIFVHYTFLCYGKAEYIPLNDLM